MTFKVFNHLGSSLVVQWLRFSVFTAEDAGLIPDQGTKIPEALKHRQKVINIYPSGFMHPYNCFICLSERAPLPFSFLSISLSPNPFPSLFSSSLPPPHFLYNFKRNTCFPEFKQDRSEQSKMWKIPLHLISWQTQTLRYHLFDLYILTFPLYISNKSIHYAFILLFFLLNRSDILPFLWAWLSVWKMTYNPKQQPSFFCGGPKI